MKGKEAYSALSRKNTTLDASLQQTIRERDELKKEVTALKKTISSFTRNDEALKELQVLTGKLLEEQKISSHFVKEKAIWESRAQILARVFVQNVNDENFKSISEDAIEVLAAMQILPDVFKINRVRRQNLKSAKAARKLRTLNQQVEDSKRVGVVSHSDNMRLGKKQ